MRQTLRSEQHGRISDRIMLINFSGRKSGKQYSVPVSYMREGQEVICFSDSPWWKNLEGGAKVTLTLQGQDLPAYATPTTDLEAVVAGLRRLIAKDANDAQFFGVKVDAEGRPDEQQLRQAASQTAMISIALAS